MVRVSVYSGVYLHWRVINVMPTRTSQKRSGQSRNFPDTLWVKCELKESDKDDLQRRAVDAPELLSALGGIIEQGFKISISYDERSDCVGAYLTAPKEMFAGRVVCLSARAPDMARAVLVLLYKHFEVLHEDWSQDLPTGGGKGQWG